MIHPQFVTPTAVVEIVTTENYTDITSSPLTFFSNPGASTNSGNIHNNYQENLYCFVFIVTINFLIVKNV